MSDCHRFEELISLSVSGELSPAEREELRSHLANCESCRLTHARETRLWALIQQARSESPAQPAKLADRLAARARTASTQSPRRSKSWFLRAGAAAAGLILVAALASRSGSGAPAQVAEVASGRLLVKDGEDWREATTLLSGQVFRVPGEPGSSARLSLADGSRLDLERGMTGWLGRGFARSDAAGRRVELCGGALTAEVAKGRGEFKVKAPGGEVTATGTRFWVRSGAPEGKEGDIVGKREIVSGTLAAALAVAVFEGSVLVQAAGAAEPVPVKAGEQAAAAAGAPVAVGERTVASAVPEGALLFVSAAGRSRWVGHFGDSNLGAAYREEEVRRFLSPLFEKAQALVADRKKQVETNLQGVVNFAEIERALVGEVGLAVLDVKPKPDGAGEDPVLLLVAEVGENAQAFETGMDEFVRRVQGMLAGAGAPAAGDLRARSYRGADLRTFAVDKTTIAYARTKGYFLFAFDPASVEKGIDCLEGATPSLAGEPAFRKSENGLLAATANAAAIIARERAKNPDNKDWTVLEGLGLAAARRLSYRLDFDKPLFRERLSAEVSEAKGLLSLLKEARPVDARKLAAEAPADALLFAAANLPADKVLAVFFDTLDAVAPKEADRARRNLLQVKAQGVDLEALLTKSLTGETSFWATMPPAGAGMMPEAVLVLGTKDNAPVESMVQMLAREAYRKTASRKITTELNAGGEKWDEAKFYELLNKEVESFQLAPVDYKGSRLFALPAENGNPLQVTAVLLPGKVIFATNAMAAKRATGKPAAALADKAEFRDGLATLSPGAVAVQYLDAPRAFGMAYGTAAPFLTAWRGADRLKQRWGLDLQNLPPAEVVSKHLSPEVGAFYADGKGLALEARTNLPRALIVAGAAGAGAAARGRNAPARGPDFRAMPAPEHEEF